MSQEQAKEQVEPQEEIVTLENPDVCTKYRTAAEIANKALTTVLAACKDGADIFELCKIGTKNNSLST